MNGTREPEMAIADQTRPEILRCSGPKVQVTSSRWGHLMKRTLVLATLAVALLTSVACSSGLSRNKALAILESHSNELPPWRAEFHARYSDSLAHGGFLQTDNPHMAIGPNVVTFYRSMVEKGLLAPPSRSVIYNGTIYYNYRVAGGVEGINGDNLSLIIGRPRFSAVRGIQQSENTATVEAELEYVLTETGKRYVEVEKNLGVQIIKELVLYRDSPSDTADPISPPKIVQSYVLNKWDDGWRLAQFQSR